MSKEFVDWIIHYVANGANCKECEKVEDSFISDLSPVELYFGNQFYDEEIQQMKDGFVDITKRSMKELCE